MRHHLVFIDNIIDIMVQYNRYVEDKNGTCNAS